MGDRPKPRPSKGGRPQAGANVRQRPNELSEQAAALSPRLQRQQRNGGGDGGRRYQPPRQQQQQQQQQQRQLQVSHQPRKSHGAVGGGGGGRGGGGKPRRSVGVMVPSLPPWIPADMKRVSLGDDIRLFADYISPTPQEIGMRNDVIRRLRALLRELWPRARVNVFGSFATGLCLPMSDLDFVVSVDTDYAPLPILEHVLLERFDCSELEAITKARVPLIKFRDRSTNVAVDVSFNADNGPRNCAIVRHLLEEYPEARPLILVLKYILHSNCLSEVYYGGLGSYTLTLMVVSFLQMQKRNGGSLELGALFIGFLELYGINFNYEVTGISIKDGGSYFPKKKHGWLDPNKPFLLSVEDPDNPENDVGKGSFNILSVRMLFGHLFSLMSQTSGYLSPLSMVIVVPPQLQQYRAHAVATFHPETAPDLADSSPVAPTPSPAPSSTTISSSDQKEGDTSVIVVDDDD